MVPETGTSRVVMRHGLALVGVLALATIVQVGTSPTVSAETCTITGTSDGEELIGTSGRDVMYGGPDGDDFRGTIGSAAGVPGDGADTVIGGSGPDSVSYFNRTAGVKVTLDGIANDGVPNEHDSVGVLTASGTSDIESINGGKGDEVLNGDAGPNVIVSRGGNDTLNGNGGADTLDTWDKTPGDTANGGAGNDACAIDAADARSSCESFPVGGG